MAGTEKVAMGRGAVAKSAVQCVAPHGAVVPRNPMC